MQNPRILTMQFEMEGKRELRIAAVSGAPEDELLVATASVKGCDGSTLAIYQLHVAPGWRGNGVGTAIVDEVERIARGMRKQAVSAVVAQEGPLEFWEKLGYEVAHEEAVLRIVSKRVATTQEAS